MSSNGVVDIQNYGNFYPHRGSRIGFSLKIKDKSKIFFVFGRKTSDRNFTKKKDKSEVTCSSKGGWCYVNAAVCVSYSVHVFASSFNWFIVLSMSFMIVLLVLRHSIEKHSLPMAKTVDMTRYNFYCQLNQEPITRSVRLPDLPVTAVSQTDLFLV